jgi:hypothetical protein
LFDTWQEDPLAQDVASVHPMPPHYHIAVPQSLSSSTAQLPPGQVGPVGVGCKLLLVADLDGLKVVTVLNVVDSSSLTSADEFVVDEEEPLGQVKTAGPGIV